MSAPQLAEVRGGRREGRGEEEEEGREGRGERGEGRGEGWMEGSGEGGEGGGGGGRGVREGGREGGGGGIGEEGREGITGRGKGGGSQGEGRRGICDPTVPSTSSAAHSQLLSPPLLCSGGTPTETSESLVQAGEVKPSFSHTQLYTLHMMTP